MAPILTHSRWCLLKRPENLTTKQEVKLSDLLRYNLKEVRSYLLKEDFQSNLFSSQRQGIETRKEKDVILGQGVEWIAWEEKQNGKTAYRYETIIEI